jgi:hypothetical protein
VADRFRFITGWAPAFREAAKAVEEGRALHPAGAHAETHTRPKEGEVQA